MTDSPEEHDRNIVPPPADDLRNLWIGGPNDPSISRDQWDSQTQQAPEATWVDPDVESAEPDEAGWQYREPPRQQARAASSFSTCDNCGAVLGDGESFCPSCGQQTTHRHGVEETFAKHPESVAEFGPPAGFGRRLVAFVIDSIIVGLALGLLFPVALNRPFIDIDGMNEYFDYVGELMREAGNEPDSQGSAPEVPPVPERAAAAVSNLQFSSLINAILFCLYQAILIGMIGTTLGKKALGVYILDRNGNVMGIPRSIARAVPMFASILFFYFGFIFALFRSDNRTLHDLLADTYPVITRPSQESVTR